MSEMSYLCSILWEIKKELAKLNKNIVAANNKKVKSKRRTNIPNDITFKTSSECKTYLELLGYKGFRTDSYISPDSLVIAEVALNYPNYDIKFRSVYKKK